MTYGVPTAPWRVLRPFSELGCSHLDRLIGKSVIFIVPVVEWANLVNPGDPVELVDSATMQVRMTGTAVLVGKATVRDIPKGVFLRSCGCLVFPQCAEECTKEHTLEVLFTVYPQLTENSQVCLLDVHITDVPNP